MGIRDCDILDYGIQRKLQTSTAKYFALFPFYIKNPKHVPPN